MRRKLGTFWLLIAAFAALSWTGRAAFAQRLPESADADRTEDVIAAREALMVAAEDLMRPIDTYTVDDSIDPELMRTNAKAIAAMLQTVPFLFPKSSNLYDAQDDLPATLALPAVWESFDSFTALAEAAAAAASMLAEADHADALLSGSLGLRATCDACHEVYLLPYEPPTVSEDELNIDFDFGN